MNELFDIKDNVTVITGGTGILGRAIAKYLAANGAIVIILGRKEDVGRRIAEDITAAGGKCEFLKTDVMDKAVVVHSKGFSRNVPLHLYCPFSILSIHLFP